MSRFLLIPFQDLILQNDINLSVMVTVPVVFAFDDNLILPACVSITSLLYNANKDTFYEIFILHAEKDLKNKELLNRIPLTFSNCRITYRIVGNVFEHAFEIRDITTPAYYRLLIPQIIPEYDRVIYADVDIIFRSDLSELFQMDLGEHYLAATYDWGMIFGSDGQKHIQSTEGLTSGDYFQSGFLLLNSALMRKDNLVPAFIEASKRKYKFQDQDILNIVCGLRRVILPIKYNMTDYAFYYVMNDRERLLHYCSHQQIEEAKQVGTLHYNGHKPWKKLCVNFDIWWEYYRRSPIYDDKYYFDFFHSRLNELDLLPLWKRIKLLFRYFIYPPKK